MEANQILFLDLTYIFLAASGGGLIAWRLRLPLILGFVLGGIVISPITPGPKLSDLHSFEVFAEVGVVLLMFSIGVDFSIPDLLRVKWVALAGGPIGISLVIGLAMLLAKLGAWGMTEGVVIGAAISVASTMVLASLLTHSGNLKTSYGRVMIGITLVEDLAVVCIAVLLPILGGGSEDDRIAKAGWILGKAFVLLVPLAFIAIKAIPRLLRYLKRTDSPELSLVVAIAICLGTAAVTQAAGFSIVLGAFLAGLSISGSDDLRHAHAQLIPVRDAFVALFFVSVGALITPSALAHSLPLLGTMLLLIVAGKFVIWTVVVRLFHYPLWTAIAVASGLTQIGELSFVLVQVARSSGIVAENVFSTTLAASLISILLNVFIVRGTLAWLGRKFPSAVPVNA